MKKDKFKSANPNLQLVMFYDRKHNRLIPLFGQRIDSDVWYINLQCADNQKLYKDVPFDSKFYCLLIDSRCGMLIAQSTGRAALLKAYKQYYRKELTKFKDENWKTYAKYCGEYTTKLIELNEEYGSVYEWPKEECSQKQL